MSLEEKLVALRKQNGLTQMELAEKLNVSRQAISRWEVGTAVPSVDNLKILGELYGVQVDFLLSDNIGNGSDVPSTAPIDSPSQENIKSKKRSKWLWVCILAGVIIIAALACVKQLNPQEQQEAIPIGDMNKDAESDYTTFTFSID